MAKILEYLRAPIIAFSTQKDFEYWLTDNCTKSSGIWLQLYKKNSCIPSITYPEAVESALCFGWIDSQVKKYDEKSYLQKFTPRKAKSPWSQINKEKVKKLIREKRIRPEGMRQIEIAKRNGEWDRAYESPTTMKAPQDFLDALSKNKAAKTFFDILNRTNQYYFLYWITSAKRDETRQKRILESIKMLEKKEKKNP